MGKKGKSKQSNVAAREPAKDQVQQTKPEDSTEQSTTEKSISKAEQQKCDDKPKIQRNCETEQLKPVDLSTQKPPKSTTKSKKKKSSKSKPKCIVVDCDTRVAAGIVNEAVEKKLIASATARPAIPTVLVKSLTPDKKKHRSMISCTTNDEKSHIIELLKSRQLAYHTFADKSDVARYFALKGLSGYSDKKAKALINRNLVGYSVRVKRMSDPADEDVPVFQVSIGSREISLTHLQTKHSTLDGTITVQWEKLRKYRNDNDQIVILQCFRCQGFGHLANKCTREYKCVKCAGNHGPGNCRRRSKDSDVPLKCANCGEDHAANSELCDARSQYYIKAMLHRNRKIAERSGESKAKPEVAVVVPPPKREDVINAERQQRMIKLLMEKVAAQKETIDELQANN